MLPLIPQHTTTYIRTKERALQVFKPHITEFSNDIQDLIFLGSRAMILAAQLCRDVAHDCRCLDKLLAVGLDEGEGGRMDTFSLELLLQCGPFFMLDTNIIMFQSSILKQELDVLSTSACNWITPCYYAIFLIVMRETYDYRQQWNNKEWSCPCLIIKVLLIDTMQKQKWVALGHPIYIFLSFMLWYLRL